MAEVEEAPVKKPRRGLKIGCGILGVAFLGAVLFYGPAICDFYKVYGPDLLSKPKKHEYSATSEKNLRAMYQAMVQFHESEGQYPDSAKWMDSVENYIHSNDLKKGEAQKKLIRPDLAGQEGKFGYAMNDAASAKYKDDIKDPSKTPLIFESKETARNAHGNPKDSQSGMAISVDGTILKMP
jgi:hypothetical protein